MDKFIEFLVSLKGQHVYYYPNPGNSGDAFIALATYYLFERFDISFDPITPNESIENKTILFGGGGNLVEGKYLEMAQCLKHFLPNNKCVLLPHTVFGYSDIINNYATNLKMFVRDPISYQICRLNGVKEHNIDLVHDITLYMPEGYFSSFTASGKGRAVCLRTDSESSGKVYIPTNNLDISLTWNGSLWHNKLLSKHVTSSLASYLTFFAEVETDRLHIAILAGMLGKKVIFYPNNYYKNRAIYEHSLAEKFLNINFVNTDTDLIHSDYITSLLKNNGILY